MKKCLIVLLCLLWLPGLSGCRDSDTPQNPVNFYYQSASLDYAAQNAVISPEIREGANYATLEEALTDYLAGPESHSLNSPFPADLTVISIRQEENVLHITLSDQLSQLQGLELTIACCCIAATCLDLTEATDICIRAENLLLDDKPSITLNWENMRLLDQTQQPKE